MPALESLFQHTDRALPASRPSECSRVLSRQIPCIEQPPATACSLIPLYLSTAILAGPFLLFRLQPFVLAVLLYVLKIGLHCPVVRPFIVHEIVKIFARVIATEATEVDILILCAFSELTLFSPIMDVITKAATAGWLSARTAVETTRPVL